jgi:hypothetical protein
MRTVNIDFKSGLGRVSVNQKYFVPGKSEKKTTRLGWKRTLATLFVSYLISLAVAWIYVSLQATNDAGKAKQSSSLDDNLELPIEHIPSVARPEITEPQNQSKTTQTIVGVEKEIAQQGAEEKNANSVKHESQTQDIPVVRPKNVDSAAVESVSNNTAEIKSVNEKPLKSAVIPAEDTVPEIKKQQLSPIETIPIPTLSEVRLEKTMTEYVNAYNQGKLLVLSNMFHKDIRSNEQKGQVAVLASYQKLFDITMERQLHIDHMDWDIQSATAIGRGRFEVRVRQRGNTLATVHSGQMQLNILASESRLLITEILYNYDN